MLTIKYTGVVALLLLLFALINLIFQYFYLSKQLDLVLQEDLEIIQDILLTNDIVINPMKNIEGHEPKAYERFVEIWSENGKALYHSSAFRDRELPPPPNPTRYSKEARYFSFQFPSGEEWRTIGSLVEIGSERRIVRISISKEHLYEQIFEIFEFMTIVVPFFLLTAVFVGYVLARHALRPIDVMVHQAKRIGTENLKERLTVVNPDDELGNLAQVTNDLLDRIQYSFQELKNFTADASHELRTPLTAMRSVGEVGLQPGQPEEHYHEVIGSMLEENSRLTHLVDCLLFLSKADSEKLTLSLEEFELNEFLEETKDILLILAEEKNQQLSVQKNRPITVTADKTLLRRAVLNLIDNAIKYTPEQGIIFITAVPAISSVRISVSDSGNGIPEEQREKIFDRFYRLDKDRSRETGGVGLGLSIVQWIMSVHNGSVKVESSEHGSTFILELPFKKSP